MRSKTDLQNFKNLFHFDASHHLCCEVVWVLIPLIIGDIDVKTNVLCPPIRDWRHFRPLE